MRNTTRIILISLLLLSVFCSVSFADTSEINNKLLGTWKFSYSLLIGEISFNSDGGFHGEGEINYPDNYIRFKLSGSWEVNDGVLTEKIESSSHPELFPIGEFSNEKIVSLTEDRLIIESTDGSKIIYTKKLSPAEELEHERLVDEYLSLVNINTVLNNALETQKKQLEILFNNDTSLTYESEESKNEFINDILQNLEKFAGSEVLIPTLKNLVSNAYTDEELIAINNFYSSPIGQKVLQKMPEISNNIMNFLQGQIELGMQQYSAIAQKHNVKPKE